MWSWPWWKVHQLTVPAQQITAAETTLSADFETNFSCYCVSWSITLLQLYRRKGKAIEKGGMTREPTLLAICNLTGWHKVEYMLYILATWWYGSSQLCMHSCSFHPSLPISLTPSMPSWGARRRLRQAFLRFGSYQWATLAIWRKMSSHVPKTALTQFSPLSTMSMGPGRYLSICHVGCTVYVCKYSGTLRSPLTTTKTVPIFDWNFRRVQFCASTTGCGTTGERHNWVRPQLLGPATTTGAPTNGCGFNWVRLKFGVPKIGCGYNLVRLQSVCWYSNYQSADGIGSILQIAWFENESLYTIGLS